MAAGVEEVVLNASEVLRSEHTDRTKIDRSKSYHVAGKVFSAFSEYNFTRPQTPKFLTNKREGVVE